MPFSPIRVPLLAAVSLLAIGAALPAFAQGPTPLTGPLLLAQKSPAPVKQPGSQPSKTAKLVATAMFAPSGPPVTKDITFEVYRPEKAADDTREHVATLNDARSVFDLPVGHYTLVFKSGLVTTEQEVEVAPGKPTEVKVVANAGVLEIAAPEADEIVVLAANEDIYGEKEELTRIADRRLVTAAPAGSLTVQALKEGELLSEKIVEIAPGKRNIVSLP